MENPLPYMSSIECLAYVHMYTNSLVILLAHTHTYTYIYILQSERERKRDRETIGSRSSRKTSKSTSPRGLKKRLPERLRSETQQELSIISPLEATHAFLRENGGERETHAKGGWLRDLLPREKGALPRNFHSPPRAWLLSLKWLPWPLKGI